MLDIKLANVCLDYLNFDRLGVNEVRTYLGGGDRGAYAVSGQLFFITHPL
jgi:hypothetical protein